MAFNSTTIGHALGASPEIDAAYQALWEGLWRQRHLPPVLLELARLRLAAMYQAPGEMALRTPNIGDIEEAKIDSVLTGRWPQNSAFSAAEKAILDFTEIYAQDPSAISDEQAAAVSAHFGDSGLVCLVEALGFIDGRLRLAALFNAFGDLP